MLVRIPARGFEASSLLPTHFPLSFTLVPRLLKPNALPKLRNFDVELATLYSLIAGLAVPTDMISVDALYGVLHQPWQGLVVSWDLTLISGFKAVFDRPNLTLFSSYGILNNTITLRLTY